MLYELQFFSLMFIVPIMTLQILICLFVCHLCEHLTNNTMYLHIKGSVLNDFIQQ